MHATLNIRLLEAASMGHRHVRLVPRQCWLLVQQGCIGSRLLVRRGLTATLWEKWSLAVVIWGGWLQGSARYLSQAGWNRRWGGHRCPSPVLLLAAWRCSQPGVQANTLGLTPNWQAERCGSAGLSGMRWLPAWRRCRRAALSSRRGGPGPDLFLVELVVKVPHACEGAATQGAQAAGTAG